MARTRRPRVWFAKFNRRRQTLFETGDFAQDILKALDPDREIAIGWRRWRLSQPHLDTSENAINGKLGFSRARDEVVYQDHDYVVTSPSAPQRNFVFYSIDIPTRIIAFNDLRPDIDRDQFLRALRVFAESYGFDVDPLGDEKQFAAWLSSVDRVISFRAILVPPNPWTHAEQTRFLITEPRSERTVLDLQNKKSPDGLQIRGTVAEVSAEHAKDGNGEFRVVGYRGAARTIFESSSRLLQTVMEIRTDERDDTIFHRLLALLREHVRPSREDDKAR